MKIAFIYPEFENIGIEYLSSVLKANGHETELFFDPKLFNDTIIVSFVNNFLLTPAYI